MAPGSDPGSPGEPVHVRAVGVCVAVDFGSAPAGAREAFVHTWSRALGAPTPDEPVVTVLAPGPPAVPDVATVLHQLSSSVTLAALEAAAGRLWMLHAAGLADPATGAAVALVAPSGTGKSTAARTLGRRLGYLSDETVGLTAEARVLPHAKPLSIVLPGSPVKEQVSPDDAGLALAPDDATLRAVIVLTRDDSATPWLEPLRTAAALPVLSEQTSYLTRLPRPLAHMAGILERTDGVHRLHYRDIADAVPLLQELLR